MLRHAICKQRTTKVNYFRVHWNPIEYACRDANGSLLPVPPGTTRRRLYCGQCRAEKCLFSGAVPAAREEHQRRIQAAAARKRARGLNTAGQPLKRTCWNCSQLRIKLGGYVCRFEPEASPLARGQLTRRYADGCQSFDWRRVMEIPTLEA